MAGAVELLRMQLEGKQRGHQTLIDLARNQRMKQILGKFAASHVSSRDEFDQFVSSNNLSVPETVALAGVIKSQRNALAPQEMYGSAAGVGVFNKASGQVVVPVDKSKGFGSAEGSIYNKDTGDIVHPKYTATDYYRLNPDGSVESRKARSPAEARVFGAQGFKQGAYRSKALGEGAESKPIKTWILPNKKLWHAPSDITPPDGARPFSEASTLEQRLYTSQELTSIRGDKRQVRRELDRIMALPEGISIYKPQKARIPELKDELKYLNQREQSLLGHGNSMNVESPSESMESPVELGGLKATDYDGKVLVNPETGERRKSVDGKWKKIEGE